MRSSKSRSRSKSNRNNNNRSVGNIVNRVFDSSGPEGKVRGTPQQIIDKYNQLTRDAQLSNDRVAAENFAQHAEHYTRMLSEAQREQDAKREQQERENQQRQRERDAERAARQEQENAARSAGQEADQERGKEPRGPQSGGAQVDAQAPADGADEFAAATVASDTPLPDGGMEAGDSGLVATPESAPKPKPKPRRRAPRKPKAEAPDAAE